jgi:hypothetical protein
MVSSKWSVLLIYALVTSICWAVSSSQVSALDALRTGGVQTQAIVTTKDQSDGKMSSYSMGLEFMLDGQAHWGNIEVTPDQFMSVQPGNPFLITYLPSKADSLVPGVVTRAEVERLRLDWEKFLSVLTVLATIIFGALALAYESQARLLRNGIAVQATVTNTKILSPGKGSRRHVSFSYGLPSGEACQGVAVVPNTYVFAFKTDDIVPYVYPSEKPAKGRLLPALRLVCLPSEDTL